MKKEAWEFFKINFRWILVGGLFAIMYFQGCFDRFNTPQQPTITHDTTVIIHQYESQPYTPTTINVLPPKPDIINLPEYQPDTSSIQNLRKQFDALVNKHTQQNVYNDTLKIDSLGWVNVKDTISENKLSKRSYNFNIKERLITTTITQPYKPRNQIYFGGGIQSSINQPAFNQAEVGLLFKNKKDNVFSISGTYEFPTSQTGIKVGYYNKITFNKK